MKLSYLQFLIIFISLPICAQESLFEKETADSRIFSYVSLRDTAFQVDPFQMEKPAFTLTQDVQKQKKSRPFTKFIVPTVCITYGVVARFNDTPIRNFDKHIAGQVDRHVTRHYGIDNELQLIPAIVGYGLDFIPGIESEHNFRDRTMVYATSYLFMYGAVQITKKATSVTRPRGWYDDSFPSGHTSVAFTGAHLLFKEYKHISPWIGVGGYTIATATGVLRVMNRAHWVSDVVTAAGVGILSAEIGYLMLPVWHRLFGIESSRRSMVFMPSVNTHSVGLGMVCTF
ncbi:MAG: phosphatase PAP2 family protein [Tannerella sp.]|jgi:membrane-associated phospholipid phosphatase|nr:phosphatase PAP2 family protein [Tannerella sp.]